MALVPDPLGHGANLFGTADWKIDLFMGFRTIWYRQVALVVVGHLAATVASL